MIRILLADTAEDFLVSQVLMKMLKFESDFEGIGMVYLFDDNVIQLVKDANPDVFIASISLRKAANQDVIELIGRIVGEIAPCPVIVYSVDDNPDTIREYMLAGVVTYLLYPLSMEDLFKAIRSAYNNSQSPPIMY